MQQQQHSINPAPSVSSAFYAELHCISNFSFLRGASRPEELVEAAVEAGYSALAITDECSMAGVVRGWTRALELEKTHEEIYGAGTFDFQLIIGTEFLLDDGFRLVALASRFEGYRNLCKLISDARRKAEKGSYVITREMLEATDFAACCLILAPPYFPAPGEQRYSLDPWFDWFAELASVTAARSAHVALELHYGQFDQQHRNWLLRSCEANENRTAIPLVACGDVHMHSRQRRALQDVVTCIRHNCTLDEAGRRLFPNGEHHLRNKFALRATYPADLLQESLAIAACCSFRLGDLSYTYPREIVPDDQSPQDYLRQLTYDGLKWRWPQGASNDVIDQIEHELALVREMEYEPVSYTHLTLPTKA